MLSAPGHPVLTVVGEATSVTNSADGWVTPGEITRLHTPGTPGSEQMLYRFRDAGTAAAVRADAAAVSRVLPSGAVTAVQSYLTVREQETSQIGPFVPFLVAFGVIGLVMSVLIVANVVSGAVVSGYRRIGILKSIGFTPGQVVAAYTVQVLVPALAGVLAGLVAGDLLAMMLLRQAANAYGVGQLSVPVWVDVAVPVAMLGLVAIAALLPAMGASRLSAVQAIAAGRAPRAGRGYAAHRLLRRLRLPRPVTIGLAAPFARPARTAITLVAVLLGATAVTFAIGLGSSLNRVVGGLSHSAAEPVQIYRNSQNSFIFTVAQQRTVQAALAAQPGTRRYVAETDNHDQRGRADRAASAHRVPRPGRLDRLPDHQRALVYRPGPGGRVHWLPHPDRQGRRRDRDDRAGRQADPAADRRGGFRRRQPRGIGHHRLADPG